MAYRCSLVVTKPLRRSGISYKARIRVSEDNASTMKRFEQFIFMFYE